MYKLECYVPESHLEAVKQAMFAAGAGCANHYDQCAWQVRGDGQFRPLSGSQPFFGAIDQLQKVIEYKLEMICDDAHIRQAVQALLDSHPYQQPAYAISQILTLDDF